MREGPVDAKNSALRLRCSDGLTSDGAEAVQLFGTTVDGAAQVGNSTRDVTFAGSTVGRTYVASMNANVISTAGEAVLSVADPSPTSTGHLVNGSYPLPQPLQARARRVKANDGLRTGTYSNTLTFTLSTRQP